MNHTGRTAIVAATLVLVAAGCGSSSRSTKASNAAASRNVPGSGSATETQTTMAQGGSSDGAYRGGAYGGAQAGQGSQGETNVGNTGVAASGGNQSGPSTQSPTSATAVLTTATSKLGTILVDGSGRTLYVFDKDQGTTSACSGPCATNWPGFTAGSKPTTSGRADGTKVGIVKQPNGSFQVTYAGHLLYLFAGDSKAGDMNGQGIGGVWHVMTPTGTILR